MRPAGIATKEDSSSVVICAQQSIAFVALESLQMHICLAIGPVPSATPSRSKYAMINCNSSGCTFFRSDAFTVTYLYPFRKEDCPLTASIVDKVSQHLAEGRYYTYRAFEVALCEALVKPDATPEDEAVLKKLKVLNDEEVPKVDGADLR
jgi:hypothetical protein